MSEHCPHPAFMTIQSNKEAFFPTHIYIVLQERKGCCFCFYCICLILILLSYPPAPVDKAHKCPS